MAYDNSKLEKAVGSWLKAKCTVGYGEVYSGALQASFEEYLEETAALKCSPGCIAFGKEMNRRGFGRKRKAGLQYMTGLDLFSMPKNVVERRLSRGNQAAEIEESERQLRASKAKEEAIKDKKKEDRAVKRRMKKETKERIANVGLKDPL